MSERLNFVCVDNSKFSDNGFDWYLKNCHRQGDTIGIVNVQKMPNLPVIGGVSGDVILVEEYHKNVKESFEESKAIRKKFEKICTAKKLKCEFYQPQPHHSPGHVICELAKQNNANNIVLGQRGLGTISRALLGSTSDYILHHAHIPVLVVPLKE